MSFTHLQIRSGYSFYNSTIQINKLISKAKQLSYDALALTDEGVLYQALPFYEACIRAKIKPIFGLTFNVTVDTEEIAVVLLAKNNKGFKKLIEISTQMELHNETDAETLFQNVDELIGIVNINHGVLKSYMLHEKFSQLKDRLLTLQKYFSKTNLYIGIESYENSSKRTLENVKNFILENDFNAIALHDVRYLEENDVESYACLQAMKHNETWDVTKISSEHRERHFRSKEEMAVAFNWWPEILAETDKIKAQCNVTFSFQERLLPKFPLQAEETAKAYLRRLCEQQLAEKYAQVTKREIERLNHELTIIDQLGFNDYFLIVSDFVQFAKNNGIIVGPGRGSAAGSFVAYLLGITNIDPLENNLVFERFLNPERVTMPDIDIDFSDKRRDEVIEYVRKKYGDDHVAQIITFGTFGPRSLLRDLMKTMEINESDQLFILKYIPVQTSESIRTIVKSEKDLAKYVKHSKKLSTLFKIAVKLEGLPRHMSTHAAGIVIGERPLIEDVPLTKGTNETVVTQYAMNELEKIGMLKIDILGLRNLSLIEQIVQSIRINEDKTFHLANIKQNDLKTFELFQKGKTNGIFQFESKGMQRALVQLKPTEQADLVALNALYRPGPMQHMQTYIKRKHKREKVTYLHPDLEPILEETYGVLIYQEQIMQVAHKFASFSMGQADLLRRAISTKNEQAMEEQKKDFIDGCLQNGYSEHVAQQLFSWIVQFANYGFNKSHSVAYSKIAYDLAYLKANYPTYFFAQLLNSVLADSTNKRTMYIREANEFGIKILAPSINHSDYYYTVENNAIRMGLLAIKGIGYDTVKAIVTARKQKPFKDLFDFCVRVKVKRSAIETLILAGAFDETYPNRASLLATITPALERAELFGSYGEYALLNDALEMKPTYIEIDDFSIMERLANEKELLQTYISNHPLKEHRSKLTLENYVTLHYVSHLDDLTNIRTVAFIQRINKIRTRRGESMAFVTLTDETYEIDSVIFPNVYREVHPLLKDDQIYEVIGKVSERNDEKQVIINRIRPFSLEKYRNKITPTIFIKLTEKNRHNARQFLLELSEKFSGNTKIILYDANAKKTYKLSNKYDLYVNEQSLLQLNEKFGTKNVVLKE